MEVLVKLNQEHKWLIGLIVVIAAYFAWQHYQAGNMGNSKSGQAPPIANPPGAGG